MSSVGSDSSNMQPVPDGQHSLMVSKANDLEDSGKVEVTDHPLADVAEKDTGLVEKGVETDGHVDDHVCDGDVPDCMGTIPARALSTESTGSQPHPLYDKKSPTTEETEMVSFGNKPSPLPAGSRPMLWCGCGNRLLVLDTE